MHTPTDRITIRRWELIVSFWYQTFKLCSLKQLNLELASMFLGLQYFNKRAVLKQIRTKTEKKKLFMLV